MSDSIISFESVGKMYKIFPSRTDNLLDAVGAARLLHREQRYREFWALREIDLELHAGERLGIIGRNGAGKSTLLKLVTGNFPPSEGRVSVRGEVQALLEIGGGLHPEFTGRENIAAALAYMGLNSHEIKVAGGGHRGVHGARPVPRPAVQDLLAGNAGPAVLRDRDNRPARDLDRGRDPRSR